jgi:predicted permease
VANLILARSVRREAELAIRAALGAGRGALRRTLLAESLLLCAAGAALGLLLADPLVGVAGRYAARFSVRALDATVDGAVLWLGAGLAVFAAVLLAYVPRLPSTGRSGGLGAVAGSGRVTPGTNRRLRIFATIQIACSFVLLAGAGMLIAALATLQTANTGYEMQQVLAIDIPPSATGAGDAARDDFVREATRRIQELPGVESAAASMVVPWRDEGEFKFQVISERRGRTAREDAVIAWFRPVSPRFFDTLGIPVFAGRDFNDDDRSDTEQVAIISESLARRLFPNGNALNGHMSWTLGPWTPWRVVGVVADVDDQHVVQERMMTVYRPMRQIGLASRLFVRAAGDPYALVPSVTRTIRTLAADQAIERPNTLEDIRAEVLSPRRLNAFVFSAFGGIALLIAVVGVAGVLAFSVSARTREFGVRLAIGSTPGDLRRGVLADGVRIATVGIAAGVAGGYVIVRIVETIVGRIPLPGALPLAAAAIVLFGAAIAASLLPAARASRIDVIQALRLE